MCVSTQLSMCIFYVVLMFSSHVHGSTYWSPISIRQLSRKDKVLTQMLQECLPKLTAEEEVDLAEPIKVYISNFESFIGREGSSEVAVLHPLDAYHFLKHTLMDWLDIEQYETSTSCIRSVGSYRKTNNYPSKEEVRTVAASIGRIQYIHKLDITDIIQGWIRMHNTSKEGFRSSKSLDTWDCMVIGKSLMERKYFKAAVDWLKAALNLFTNEDDGSASYKEILKLLKEAIGKMLKFGKEEDGDEKSMILEKMCRGEKLKKDNMDSNLSCRYFTRNRKYLYIGPMKLEEISRNPPIMMFHDFITEEESNKLIEMATPNLETSEVQNNKEGKAVSFDRVTEGFWFVRHHEETLHDRLNHRIEELTGLNVEEDKDSYASEPHQILVNAVGGLSSLHPDFVQEDHGRTEQTPIKVDNGGDRVATLLLYLSDVELGGATIFSFADVILWPKKTSIVLWYNLYKTGRGDLKTLHAGCPVLYGIKWFSSKWIHVNAQHRLSCGLSRTERHDLL